MFDLNALGQSGIVMLIGMVVIFLFLTLLIFVINGTAFAARKFGWGSDDESDLPAQPPRLAAGNGDEAVAAIAAAVAHNKKA